MARRHPSEDDKKELEPEVKPDDLEQPATPEDIRRAATTGLPPGGAAGYIPEARQAVVSAQGAPSDAKPEPKPAKVEAYRIKPGGPAKDGSWPLLVNGSIGHLRPGKIVTSTAYDIDSLREQGIGLEPVTL